MNLVSYNIIGTLVKYIVLLSEGLKCLFYVPTRLNRTTTMRSSAGGG